MNGWPIRNDLSDDFTFSMSGVSPVVADGVDGVG